MENAMNVKEMSKHFHICERVVLEKCRTKGSPAYKTGKGRTSNWLCFPSEMKEFLQKESEKLKG